MTSAVCTLFEGDYHLGLAALANSLYFNDFRGTIYAGYRGSLPPWADKVKEQNGTTEYCAAVGLTIRFIPVQTQAHLTNFKPDFMLSLWESHCPLADALFYFDPDITIKCRWTFFEEWIEAGIAICADVNASMPNNHPIRHAWRRFYSNYGITFTNYGDVYFNAGFIGLSFKDKAFLATWSNLLSYLKIKFGELNQFSIGNRTFGFVQPDQDALNAATMTSTPPISPVGQDGMDFQWGGGGWIMSHAAGGEKPWRKAMLLSLLIRGVGPSRADKSFYQFRSNPICPYSSFKLFVKTIDLKAASALARFIG